MFFDQATRDRFAANPGGFAGFSRWPITPGAALPFTVHQGNDANTTKQTANRGISLIEGGGGFRFNAVRADFDCIMRRTPYSTTLPIQDPSSFCKVCFHFLRSGLMGNPGFNALTPGSIEIDRQRLLFDQVGWTDRPAAVVSTPAQPKQLAATDIGLSEPDRRPNWQFDAAVTAAEGLKISRLKLLNRDVWRDPFFNASEVARSILFKDLSVAYRVNGPQDTLQTKQLTYADAFNAKDGVSFRVYRRGSDHMQVGVKASFSWLLPGIMTVEAEASLVVRDAAADFDPGGAGLASRYTPQLSMRYRRVAKGPKKLQVESLKGTVVVEMSSVIPENLVLPPVNQAEDPANFFEHIGHMRTGNIEPALFNDSNTSISDGRKLSIFGNGARVARSQFKQGQPPLPHWSWIFDYVTPRIALKRARPIVATYHRPVSGRNDTTKDGQFNGGQPRAKIVTWPLPADQKPGSPTFQMRVLKVARQGEYDNVHVTGDHGLLSSAPGTDPKIAFMTPAPFCADMCNHFHWRWGTVASAPAHEPYAFLGWGAGKVGQGANRVPGAPMVPPNQHIEVDVDPVSRDLVSVSYAVEAVRPGEGERQVFVEQGMALIFSYFGKIPPFQLSLLQTVFGAQPIPLDREINRTQDIARRHIFHNVYSSIKFYGDGVLNDDMARPFVLQTPAETDANGFLKGTRQVEEF